MNTKPGLSVIDTALLSKRLPDKAANDSFTDAGHVAVWIVAGVIGVVLVVALVVRWL